MKRAAMLFGLFASAAIASAVADPPATLLDEVRGACQADAQNLCPGVAAGGGRILSCLAQHQDAVSAGCKQAIMKARQAQGQEQEQSPAPVQGQSPSQNQNQSPAASRAQGHSAHSAAAQPTADRYFLMKRVQIVDDGMNKMPAVDVMIPTTWQLQGAIRAMGGMGGCFADLETVAIHAQSADGSLLFENLPNFTSQYADDPNTVRTMTQEGQAFAKGGIKPCPVLAPQRAADFLQKYLIPKLYAGRHVVSVDPYPEFNLLLRQRLGLPLNDTANQGALRTDAARARLEYDRDGRTFEEWITVAEWMRLYPSGRGNVYDCHATMLMSFSAPKGQLDGNQKLFKLIAFNVSHEPQWDAKLNAMIAQLYRQQQIEEAKRSQMIAQFQQHVADTINEVTANSMRGANQAAFGQDQVIRGVQTFRNPQTGATFELSNLHDHAWLNGNNEYVMSDDPSFNPNGQLNGNWTSLQPVRPQP
ncbi:MAG TPA: cysteine rich repeat-containing protein [Steroidobacteraceae bacterium]|nr:cysteine rich repeat-containing protein [Steroidobacteraceae bacterium]